MVIKLSEIMVGSRILIFPIPDPGVKKAPDLGSETLLSVFTSTLLFFFGYGCHYRNMNIFCSFVFYLGDLKLFDIRFRFGTSVLCHNIESYEHFL